MAIEAYGIGPIQVPIANGKLKFRQEFWERRCPRVVEARAPVNEGYVRQLSYRSIRNGETGIRIANDSGWCLDVLDFPKNPKYARDVQFHMTPV